MPSPPPREQAPTGHARPRPSLALRPSCRTARRTGSSPSPRPRRRRAWRRPRSACSATGGA
eukprot:6866471-Prymnesium_polylepis.1